MYYVAGWCTATPPACQNTPQVLFLQEQKTGLKPAVNLEPSAAASRIFSLLIQILTDQWW